MSAFFLLLLIGVAQADPPTMPPPCWTPDRYVCVDDCECAWCDRTGCFLAPARRRDLPSVLERVCGAANATHKTHAYSKSCRRWETFTGVLLMLFVAYLVLILTLGPVIATIVCCCYCYRNRIGPYELVVAEPPPHEEL